MNPFGKDTWQAWLCGQSVATTEPHVESVAMRFVAITGAAFVLLILLTIALAVVFSGAWGVGIGVALLIAWFAFAAALWWAGVALLRRSENRDGKIIIMKIVCGVFLVTFLCMIIGGAEFDLAVFSLGYALMEFLFLCLAMVYLSFALASRTTIPWAAWVAIAVALAGCVPGILAVAKAFGAPIGL